MQRPNGSRLGARCACLLLAAALALLGASCKFPLPPDVESEDGGGDHDGPGTIDAHMDGPPVDAPPGPFLVTFGGTVGNVRAAVSSAGEVIVAGTTGATTIGGEAVSAGVFVAKLRIDGAFAWVRGLPGGPVEVKGVAMAPNGDAYVVGRLDGTLSLGASSLTSSGSDGFIIKLAADSGAVAQTRLVGSSASSVFEDWEGLRAVAVDAAGNAYVTGHFTGGTRPCGIPRTPTDNWDVVVARYSAATLTCEWDRVFGSAELDVGDAIATDDLGVYVGITSRGTLNAGGNPLAATSGSGSDIVLVRYDATFGGHTWSARYHGGLEGVSALAVADGGLFVAGTFQSSLSLGGTMMTSAGGDDVYLARLAASTGAHVWSRSLGGSSTEQPIAIGVAGSELHYAGQMSGAGQYGGTPLVSRGGSDSVFASYALSDGAHAESSLVGGTMQDVGQLKMTTPYGLVLVGTFGGIVSFGSEQRASSGTDVFVWRL